MKTLISKNIMLLAQFTIFVIYAFMGFTFTLMFQNSDVSFFAIIMNHYNELFAYLATAAHANIS